MIRLRLWPFWVIMLFFTWYQGIWKIIVSIFLMMSLHECAHICAALKYGYTLSHIDIFPFGFCAQISDIGYGNVYQELFIFLAGPCMHVLYPFAFAALVRLGWISVAFSDYLQWLNRSIVMFNLLPIYPLDGARILFGFLHLIFPYGKAQRYAYHLSIMDIGIVLAMGWMSNPAGMFTLAILLVQIIKQNMQRLIDRLHFYQYRLDHPFDGRPCLHHQQDLYRMRTNYLIGSKGMLHEREWLKQILREK